jgi:hypothetical protein
MRRHSRCFARRGKIEHPARTGARGASKEASSRVTPPRAGRQHRHKRAPPPRRASPTNANLFRRRPKEPRWQPDSSDPSPRTAETTSPRSTRTRYRRAVAIHERMRSLHNGLRLTGHSDPVRPNRWEPAIRRAFSSSHALSAHRSTRRGNHRNPPPKAPGARGRTWLTPSWPQLRPALRRPDRRRSAGARPPEGDGRRSRSGRGCRWRQSRSSRG